MPITYSVHVENPNDHRAQFSVRLDGLGPGPFDVVFPSWVPGSYAILPYARNIRGFRASVLPQGDPLPATRLDKARWRLGPAPTGAIRIEYTVYGHDLITEALDVTDEHLFLNAGLCLPFIEGHQGDPCDLEIHVRPDWKILTELREIERAPPTFRAASYDELVDSPVDCGLPTVLPIAPRGVAHRLVLCGAGGNFEPHRLETDLTKMVEATATLFGELPPEPYTFFFHLTDRRDGGLEHRRSTSIVVPRTIFRPESDYLGFLRLSAHEYFHRYNVKRIRPKVLGPFDYTRENYTHLLWAMEGTTDYYTSLLLRRAGLMTPSKYLEGLATDIRRYLQIPGRLATSLEEASLTAWIDPPQPYENSVNQSVSYYLKGGLVSLCLDLEIRERTGNRSSLDAVFRTLWNDYGRGDRGIGEDELRPIMDRVTGLELTDFFRRYVSGTEEVDFPAFLRHAGLLLVPEEKKGEAGEDAPPGYLGIDFENTRGFAKVKSVRTDSPGQRAGLAPGDEIVALDRGRVAFDQFAEALKRYPAGSELDLAVFRRGYLIHLTASTGESPPEKLLFKPVEDAPPLARQIYESWLLAPWPPDLPRATPKSAA